MVISLVLCIYACLERIYRTRMETQLGNVTVDEN